jgi:polysaccharide export outer membrane protein
MWTSSPRWRLARVMLSACLSLAVATSRASSSVKSAAAPELANTRGVEKRGGTSADPAQTPSSKNSGDDYVIGPSDILAINVWKDTELSRNVTVRPDGKISLPLIGEMLVSGLTALKVQSLLTERLKQFISQPQVSVIVQEMKSRTYIIVGKITKPGSYPLGKPTTVLEAIAIAGGFVEFAKVNKLYVLRRSEDGAQIRLPFNYKKVVNGHDPTENVDLKNGDTIVVP